MTAIAIVAPSFRETTGGRVVLHRLCDQLLRADIQAYLVPWNSPAENYSTGTGYRTRVKPRPDDGDVVVYPDIVHGNPFNARRVVRWYLYHAREQPGRDDRLFSFVPAFGGHAPLYVTDPRLDVFQPKGWQREGFCWTWRKAGRQGWPDTARPTEGTELAKSCTLADLAAAFNTHERFITYDNATFMAIQARLCGCEVVVRSKTPIMPRLREMIALEPEQLRSLLFTEQAQEFEAVTKWGREMIEWK